MTFLAIDIGGTKIRLGVGNGINCLLYTSDAADE